MRPYLMAFLGALSVFVICMCSQIVAKCAKHSNMHLNKHKMATQNQKQKDLQTMLEIRQQELLQ